MATNILAAEDVEGKIVHSFTVRAECACLCTNAKAAAFRASAVFSFLLVRDRDYLNLRKSYCTCFSVLERNLSAYVIYIGRFMTSKQDGQSSNESYTCSAVACKFEAKISSMVVVWSLFE